VAVTGTNPRPVLLEGTDKLCGGALDERVLQGLDHLVRDQIMSMKTTFTPWALSAAHGGGVGEALGAEAV
jgi:hypothetical protein